MAIIKDYAGAALLPAGVDPAELGYLDGVTSDIQDQLDSKANTAGDTFTGDINMDGNAIYGDTTSDTAELHLAGSDSAWNGTSPHKVVIPNGSLQFTGQTTSPSDVVSSLIGFNETITHSNATASIVGFHFAPPIEYGTSQNLSVFPAFYANPQYNLQAGGITHGEYNLFTGFLARADYQIDHSGSTSTILEHSNYISQPLMRRINSETATATITTFANYIANQRVLFNNNVQAGVTVTDFVGFKVKRIYNSGTITNAIGVDIDDPVVGTNKVSLRSAGTDTHMRHAGSGVFGANAAPTNSSIGLEVQSTTKALLVSRMTTTQRDNLTAVDGMIIYNTTTGAFNFREGGAWVTGSCLT